MKSSVLEAALGYRFRDGVLLQTALTHRSAGANHNERLEFLGDSVLNCVVAGLLFRRFPLLPEGDLSRLRAHLVRQESLEKLALQRRLGEFLVLGDGELKSGGHRRPSILADALEAVLGAVFLDGGFEAAYAVTEVLYAEMLADLAPGPSMKDAKTRLQEWLQGRKRALPRYSLIEATGAAHDQQFQVACELDGLGVRTIGRGSSRRAAEQLAAENALKELES